MRPVGYVLSFMWADVPRDGLFARTRDASVVWVETGVAGPPGPPGPPGGAGQSFVQLTAAQALGGHRAVRVRAGQADYADCREVGAPHALLGVTTAAVSAGQAATIQQSGVMTEPAWRWQPGRPVFLGEQGALTQTAPASGVISVVGVALSAQSVALGLRAPIVLSD